MVADVFISLCIKLCTKGEVLQTDIVKGASQILVDDSAKYPEISEAVSYYKDDKEVVFLRCMITLL